MDWWNDLTDWISSDDGWRVISGAIIPFVAIVVAGLVAALIGRGATKRVVAMQEREARNAAVSGVVSAARKAATWGSLGHDERAYADHLAEDSDIRLRLLPVTGAPMAANWTQHEIADIKKNSSTFSFQAEQSLAEFRDRLLEWQARPNRARKLFKSDLERWKFDSPDPDAELIKRQQDWNADQNGSARPAVPVASDAAPTTDRPTPTTTSLRPAQQRPTQAPTPTATATAGPTVTPGSTTVGGQDGAAAAGGSSAGFSVARGGSSTTDPNATTPISDEHGDQNATTPISDGNVTRAHGDGATRAYGDGATRAYGDGVTRPYGDDTARTAAAPIRPPLGSPVSPSRTADGTTASNAGAGAGADHDPATAAGGNGQSSASARSTLGAAVSSPTSAEAHVNRAPDAGRPADAPGSTNTRSIPTRIANDPVEPADADETSEAPYTQPISASELRRRAADDDE